MKPDLDHVRFATLALLAISLLATQSARAEPAKANLPPEANPAAPGFLAAESDPEAIALANRVMTRLGGRRAWDETRIVTWKFFGSRLHIWNKHTGDIRVEGVDRETQKPYTILMNLVSKSGRAWRAGEPVTDAGELSALLDLGESAWINDSYWMFMPFKLKDTGVALKYLGERALLDGRPADVLELTFREVGRTPQNRYEIYIAKDSDLVEQWDFFANATDAAPGFQLPWRNWRRHGSILLSDDRGRRQHTDIAVLDRVPAEVFSSPDPVDLASLAPAPTTDLLEAPIYSVEGDVTRPEILNPVNPEYPAAAREAGTTGLVVVRTVIGTDGAVRDAWVTEPLDQGLDEAALAAVRQWTFAPATLDGDPVAVYYNLTVNFQLDGNGPSGSGASR